MPTGTWFSSSHNVFIVTTTPTPTTYPRGAIFDDYQLLNYLYSSYPNNYIHLSTLLLNYEEIQSHFPEYLL